MIDIARQQSHTMAGARVARPAAVLFAACCALPCMGQVAPPPSDSSDARTATTQTASAPAGGDGAYAPCRFDEQSLDAAAARGRVPLLLDAARCLIVEESAAALSDMLHGRSGPTPRSIPALDRGRALLARSAEALAAPPGADASNGDARDRSSRGERDAAANRRRWQARLDLLSAFADAFSALAADDGTDAARSRMIDAAVGLALYLDDPSSGVAASARLWQAVLYRRAGRPDRALQLLPVDLDPRPPHRVELFLRLERSRALADQGQFVAAIALATKLGAKTESWLAGDTADARRGAAEDVRRLRADLHRRWAAQLRERQAHDQAVESETAAQRILPQKDESPARLDLAETISDVRPLNEPASPPALRDAEVTPPSTTQPSTTQAASPE